jgi:hypothetical protein
MVDKTCNSCVYVGKESQFKVGGKKQSVNQNQFNVRYGVAIYLKIIRKLKSVDLI